MLLFFVEPALDQRAEGAPLVIDNPQRQEIGLMQISDCLDCIPIDLVGLEIRQLKMSIAQCTCRIIVPKNILDELHGWVPHNHKQYLPILHKQDLMLLEYTPRKLDIFDHIVLDFVDPIVEVLRKGFRIFVEQFE